MTRIYLTAKLQALFPPLNTDGKGAIPIAALGDWNGHLFTIGCRKCLVLVNNKSYYALFMVNIIKKDLARFPDLFLHHLLQQLTYDKVIDPGDYNFITAHYGQPQLVRTNNDRKVLGTINEFIFLFKAHGEEQPLDTLDLAAVNHYINDSLTGAGRIRAREYENLIEDMKALIKQQRT